MNLNRSTWKHVRFGDVINHVTDRVDPETSGLTRYLAGEHIPSESLEIRRWGTIGDGYLGPAFYKRFQPGHVLYVSRRPYLRKVSVPHFQGICGEKTFVLESADVNQIAQRFIGHLMSSERFHQYAVSQSRGSVNPYINWTELSNYEFHLPQLDDQERIADLLWAIEQHKRSLVTLLGSLQTIRSIRFELTLKDGVRIGAWKSLPITELAISGPTNGKSATANDEMRGIPTLSISAVRDGRILGGSSVKYVDINRASIEPFILADGDFLVVRGNGNKQLAGLGGLVRGGLPQDCFYPDLLIRLRFDETAILSSFAARQWNSPTTHRALLRNAKSTNGIWKINGGDIKRHQLVVPPLPAQQRIVNDDIVIESAENQISEEIEKLNFLNRQILGELFAA